ncbi:MAG: hypothetical protein WAW36_18435 [Methylovulum miyakonense]|uniref:hypothetical protein n=1 Tax=Methylovulum miyakonense TaxID=645578 RepID=UPI003BB65FF4
MMVPKRRPQKNQNAGKEASQPKFPSARYFQIHFQHMESQLDLTHRSLEALQQQMAELQARFGNAHTGPDFSKTEE